MADTLNKSKPQGLTTEQFFYFFLRVRKGEIRRTVAALRSRFPDEGPEQIAKRLIDSQSILSLWGGTFLTLPLLIPGIGHAIKFGGVAGSTSVLTRMHLYMILGIAHAFGHDIDDRARVPEMITVVAATGCAAASPLLTDMFRLNPVYSIPIGGLSATLTARLIGAAAIRYYRQTQQSENAAAVTA